MGLIEQMHAVETRRKDVRDLLERAEAAVAAALEVWAILPSDREEIELWAEGVEEAIQLLHSALDAVHSMYVSPFPDPTPGGSDEASPLPPDSPEAA